MRVNLSEITFRRLEKQADNHFEACGKNADGTVIVDIKPYLYRSLKRINSNIDLAIQSLLNYQEKQNVNRKN